MNTSWKTTVGGAFSALGVTLTGVGVVPQLGANVHSTVLTNIALAGFFCTGIGTFLSHLFAADADATGAAIVGLQTQITGNTASILTGSPTPTALANQAATVATPTKPVVPVPPTLPTPAKP